MLTNRSIPNCAVIPELGYPDISEAIDWLRDAFGFTLRIRIADHRAQLNVGDGAVVLTGGSEPPRSMLIRVDDVDALCARASQHGARVVRPPADYAYGERQCTLEDHAGHRWTFSQTIADVDPRDWGGTPGEQL